MTNLIDISDADYRLLNQYIGQGKLSSSLVFFGNERPQDIGISGSFSAYSNGVLGSVFNTKPDIFNNLPRLQQDVFLVSGAG